MRSASGSTSRPESASAWRAAATIICAKRSMRRACLCSIHSFGSNSFSSQANVTGYSLASNCSIGAAPDLPASRLSHVVSTSFPSGVTAPIPVIDDAPAPVLRVRRSHPQPAVDEKHLARDERGLVGAQEPYRSGDVLRISELARAACSPASRLAPPRGARPSISCGCTRRDDVRAHAAAAELARQRLREADDPGLRRCVVRLAQVPVQADDARDVDDRACRASSSSRAPLRGTCRRRCSGSSRSPRASHRRSCARAARRGSVPRC